MLRKIILAFFALLAVAGFIHASSAFSHVPYKNANYSDAYLHAYFSKVLEKSKNCLDAFVNEEDAFSLSKGIKDKVDQIRCEYRVYVARGIKTNISLLIDPFSLLSKSLFELTKSQVIFLKNIKILKNKTEYSAYVNCSIALSNMRIFLNKIASSVDKIDKITLWNGTQALQFDVSGLELALQDSEDLISYYESVLKKYEMESLIVSVSNTNPLLHEEITISISAKNVTPTLLHVDDKAYKIGNTSIFYYAFNTTGEHVIYAEGIKLANQTLNQTLNFTGFNLTASSATTSNITNATIVKSNVVKVYVKKIPTYIFLQARTFAKVGEIIKIKGCLVDYYSNLLKADLSARINGESRKLSTKNGYFTFNVTKNSEGILKIFVFYPGNESYGSSSTNVSILFSKSPVVLYLEAERPYAKVNETINFTGAIYGLNYSVPINILVNSTVIKTIYAQDKFNFTLNFSVPGFYIIQAQFPGDLAHKQATSNKIEIKVEAIPLPTEKLGEIVPLLNELGRYYIYLIVVVFLLILTLYVSKGMRKRALTAQKVDLAKQKTIDEEKVKVETTVERPSVIPKPTKKLDVPEGYKFLFNSIVSKYNLKRGLTPRELVEKMKDSPFAQKLRKITELHEKSRYAAKSLGEKEKETFFKLLDEILKEL